MKTRNQDSVEAVLRQADAAMKHWEDAARGKAHQALMKGAGALRHQVDDLAVGLKKLSAGLAKLEKERTATPNRRRPRRAVPARATGARAQRTARRTVRQKKAA